MTYPIKVHLRIPYHIYQYILDDLQRPHISADERVGFLHARSGGAGPGLLLLLASSYYPVNNDHYLASEVHGARIGSDAIREEMQRIVDAGDSSLHVHLHNHSGSPSFSPIDMSSISKLVLSLRNAGPSQPHGMIVFSRDQGAALVKMPNIDEFVQLEIVI